MSYPNNPALAFRNMVIESVVAVLVSIFAALVLHAVGLLALGNVWSTPIPTIGVGLAGVIAMNFTHDRLNHKRGKAP